MSDHGVNEAGTPGATRRRDGWRVTYQVEVLFDTDNDRTRYDHVSTVASCTCCGQRLDLHGSRSELARHARSHELQLSIDIDRHNVSHTAVQHKEVSPIPTPGC